MSSGDLRFRRFFRLSFFCPQSPLWLADLCSMGGKLALNASFASSFFFFFFSQKLFVRFVRRKGRGPFRRYSDAWRPPPHWPASAACSGRSWQHQEGASAEVRQTSGANCHSNVRNWVFSKMQCQSMNVNGVSSRGRAGQVGGMQGKVGECRGRSGKVEGKLGRVVGEMWGKVG